MVTDTMDVKWWQYDTMDVKWWQYIYLVSSLREAKIC